MAKPTKFAIYPYEEVGENTKVIEEQKLKNKFPKAYKYLTANKELLDSRMDSRKLLSNKSSWYGLTRFGKLSRFRKLKIVSPGEVNKNKFALDETGSAFSCARVFSITSESEKLNILHLLGLLNSKLMEFFLHNTTSLKQGGYFSYSSSAIENIPLILKNQELVSKKVEDILKLKKKGLLEQSQLLEKDIDLIVYHLYKLTFEEACLVEDNTTWMSKEAYEKFTLKTV